MNDYMKTTDRLGKIWVWTAVVVILMVPVAICVRYNAWPSLTAVLKGLLGVAPIYWTVGVIEVITYTPMLGVGGTYLAFVTGNLTSLKAPSACWAQKIPVHWWWWKAAWHGCPIVRPLPAVWLPMIV